MDGIKQELLKIPPVTRAVVLGTAVVTLSFVLQLVSPMIWVLTWPRVTQRFEIWRLATAFLLGQRDLQFLFDLFLLYRHTNELEQSHYHGRTADMTWTLTLICAIIVGLSKPLQMMVLQRTLLLGILHWWAQAFPSQRVSLFGFITMPAKYFPFAILGMDVLRGGPQAGVAGLTGIIAAQAVWFLSEIYPSSNQGRPLPAMRTPQWLIYYLGNGANQPAGGGPPRPGVGVRTGAGTAFGARPGQRLGGSSSSTTTATQPRAGAAAASSSSAPVGGYRWGRGNVLGTE